MGKTPLAREAAAAAAQRGWTVREVLGTTAAHSIPMAAFSQWTKELSGNPLHLVREVIEAITDTPAGGPTLLVVDDAHLLDDISAFTLLQIALRGVATVVVTIRTGQPAPDAVSALWKDHHLARLDLNPLSRNESDALLGAALDGPVSTGCADRVWDLTHGNVLFLRQLVDYELDTRRLALVGGQWQWDGPAGVSPTLVDIVGRQVGALPDAVFDVIDLVAVAEPLELHHLSALADADAIEDAEQRCPSPSRKGRAQKCEWPIRSSVRSVAPRRGPCGSNGYVAASPTSADSATAPRRDLPTLFGSVCCGWTPTCPPTATSSPQPPGPRSCVWTSH